MGETVVAKTSPTLTATGPATGTIGTAIPASSISSVLASGYNPTGTITFTVFGPQSARRRAAPAAARTVGTATVSGNATYNPSAATRPLLPVTTGGTPPTAATPTTVRLRASATR